MPLVTDDLALPWRWRLDYIVPDTLMRSLGVVMLHILIDDVPQVRFTEDQHLIETLGFYAPDEAFNVRGHVWTGNRCFLTVDTAGL